MYEPQIDVDSIDHQKPQSKGSLKSKFSVKYLSKNNKGLRGGNSVQRGNFQHVNFQEANRDVDTEDEIDEFDIRDVYMNTSLVDAYAHIHDGDNEDVDEHLNEELAVYGGDNVPIIS